MRIIVIQSYLLLIDFLKTIFNLAFILYNEIMCIYIVITDIKQVLH